MKFLVKRRYNQPLKRDDPSWVRQMKFGTCVYSDDFFALIVTDAKAYHLVEQSKCDVEWKRCFE